MLALDKVLPYGLTVAVEVFERARLPTARPAYRVLVCAAGGEVDAGTFTLRTRWGLDALANADTVILPGTSDPLAPLLDEVLDAVRTASRRGARMVAIGAGSFVLAAAGLLDGRLAVTDRDWAAEFAQRYPRVTVDPDAPFVDGGQLLTSADTRAGLGLCLSLIRRDHGVVVAADVAGVPATLLEYVAWEPADGGEYGPPVDGGFSVASLLRWMGENAHRELTLTEIARQGAMSTRTLSRRFREQTGTTPLQWLNQARLRRARHLLETTDFSIEQIAQQVGFGSPNTLRDHFRRLVGTSPQAYRSGLRRPSPF